MRYTLQYKVLVDLLNKFPMILVYQQYERNLLQFTQIRKIQLKRRFCAKFNSTLFQSQVIIVYNFKNFLVLHDQLDVDLIMAFLHYNGQFTYFLRVSKFLKLWIYFSSELSLFLILSFLLQGGFFWSLKRLAFKNVSA